MYDIKDSPLLMEITAIEGKRTPLYSFASFFLLLLATTMLATIPTFFYIFIAVFGNRDIIYTVLGGDMEKYTTLLTEFATKLSASHGYLLVSLLSQAITIAAVLVFTRYIAKRRLSTLGFRKKNAALFYIGGFLGGVILLGLSVLISTLNASVTLVSAANPNAFWILLFCLGFIIQGAAEEVLFRGVLMSSLLETQSPLYAILINSLFFSLMHSGNPGVSPLAFINIFLFGVLLSVLTLRCGSILPALAIHSAWNFAEGCLFGTPVSGMPAMPTLFSATLDPAKWLTNGGAFGPEGGIAVSAVLVIALLFVTLLPSNAKK